MSRFTTAAFVGSLAVITWRELNNPEAGAPLPLPLPSRYIGAAIVYGILEFMSDVWNPRISDALAGGYFLALLISTAQNGITKSSSGGGSTGSAPVQGTQPNTDTGGTNSGGGFGNYTGPGFLNPPPGIGLE